MLLELKPSKAVVGRASPWAIGKMAMVMIGTIATLLLGMFVGVNDLHAASVRCVRYGELWCVISKHHTTCLYAHVRRVDGRGASTADREN